MLDVIKTETDNTATLTLTGRVESMTAPKLEEVLIPAYETMQNVTLDFAALEYISSAGLRVLLMGEKKSKEKGGKQTLINVSEAILEVFEMTGFDSVLNIE
ncbi:MAG: STAS domain-containing protein [Oscillospiraceae bacterium]|nr:STAS domain-containing protein [Oscillospiraceae bacterium]